MLEVPAATPVTVTVCAVAQLPLSPAVKVSEPGDTVAAAGVPLVGVTVTLAPGSVARTTV